MKSLREYIDLVNTLDQNQPVNEGVNEAWTFAGSGGKTPDGLAIEDQLDRDFTGRSAYNSNDNGYFAGEKTPWGTWKKKHKKWPQYDLYSTDGGKTYAGNWTGRSQGAKSNDVPNTKNNGWMATMDLVDAEETTGATLLMPPDLVDTAGMRSNNPGLGYSNSPSMQAKRAMQFAQQMGFKDWNPKQGFDVVANYIPYALHVGAGERFKNQASVQKIVRVPVNLFSDAERADIAKARWSGSNTAAVTVGGYSLFHPGAPQNGAGLEDEEDKDIVLGQPRKQGSASNRPAASGGVFAADASTTEPIEKVKTIPFDPKVKAMQEEILAKDPAALKFGADGKLGPETVRAIAQHPDIARKYLGIVMTTGISIKSAVKDVAKGIKDIGKDIWNKIINESDNDIRTLINTIDSIDQRTQLNEGVNEAWTFAD